MSKLGCKRPLFRFFFEDNILNFLVNIQSIYANESQLFRSLQRFDLQLSLSSNEH